MKPTLRAGFRWMLVERLAPVRKLIVRARGGEPRLELDFVSAQRVDRSYGLYTLVAAALLLTTVLWKSDITSERVARLESELASLGVDHHAEKRRAAAKPSRSADQEERVRKANRVVRQLSMPWEDVFRTIEAVNGKDIAVLSLDPDPVSAQVRVGAEARNTEAMIEYLERLREGTSLSPSVLQAHQVMTEDPHKPIRFSFTASWTSAKNAPN